MTTESDNLGNTRYAFFGNKRPPPTETLAMLAATMGKEPEEALRLWLKTQFLLEQIQDAPNDLRQYALELFFRMEDKSFGDCLLEADVYLETDKAMEYVGVFTKPTFEKLLLQVCQATTIAYHYEHGFPRKLLDELKRIRKQQNVQRGVQNRKNASMRRKRKHVK